MKQVLICKSICMTLKALTIAWINGNAIVSNTHEALVSNSVHETPIVEILLRKVLK
jgi:hypothetical protein